MRYGRKGFRSEIFFAGALPPQTAFQIFCAANGRLSSGARFAYRHAFAVADRMDEAGDTLFC